MTQDSVKLGKIRRLQRGRCVCPDITDMKPHRRFRIAQPQRMRYERSIMFKKITTDKAPAAIGPYSQAIIAGDFLFASGQIPINPATGNIEAEGIEAQAEQVMKNIGAILAEAGCDYTRVVKTGCFLADMGDFAAFNGVYEKYFTEKPARSCVAVKELPKGVLCEIEAIAVKQ